MVSYSTWTQLDQNYTCIRIVSISVLYLYQSRIVASHLIPSKATTPSTILDSQKAEFKDESTHTKKALFTGFMG